MIAGMRCRTQWGQVVSSYIQLRIQTSLPVPPKIAQRRRRFHNKIAAEAYSFRREKASVFETDLMDRMATAVLGIDNLGLIRKQGMSMVAALRPLVSSARAISMSLMRLRSPRTFGDRSFRCASIGDDSTWSLIIPARDSIKSRRCAST